MDFDFFASFTEFMTEMQEIFPDDRDILEQFEDDITQAEDKMLAVKNVLDPFRPYSRNILSHDDEMFNTPMICFGGVDLSKIYHSADPNTQFAIWKYLEMLYISGNIYLKPHKKDQFLKAVFKIKQKYPPKLPNFPAMERMDESAIDNATNHLQQLFGGNENSLMGDLLGDVAKSVGKALKDNDPKEVLQNILSGDMSVFGSTFEEMDQKYGKRLENGEIDSNQFMKSASQIMPMLGGGQENASGENGINPMALMGMMQNMMGNGGLGGLFGEQQQQFPHQQPEIHDVQESPYFTVRDDTDSPEEDVRDPPSDSEKSS